MAEISLKDQVKSSLDFKVSTDTHKKIMSVVVKIT